MVEIADIKDHKSLDAWLNDQPQRYSVIIAHRAAMRVLPEYWRWIEASETALEEELTPIPVLWANLVSGVLAFGSTHEMSDELSRAAAAAETASRSIHFAKASIAAAAAARAASVSFPNHAADAVVFAMSSWIYIQQECINIVKGVDLEEVSLWGGDSHLLDQWETLKPKLIANDVDWSFWIKWYEAALNGEPLSRKMLEQVALIKLEDWEQGPKHVNELIAGIEAAFEVVAPPVEVTPIQMLSRNKSVIDNQLGALVQLVTEEMNRIRGRNDFTKAEGTRIAARVSVLESILAAVDKIKAALADEEPSTALAIIEAQLPEVFDGAEKLELLKPEDVLSDTIIAMGVAVKYLTGCGMSSADATKVAMGDLAVKKTKSWFGRKKEK